MNLISRENNTALVEVFGLSKSKPHNSTSLKGIFVKTTSGIWILQSVEN